MKQSEKQIIAIASVLLLLAAFFSIAIMMQFLNFGAGTPSTNSVFFSLGSVLYQAYGYSSILIPIFLFVAAILLFVPNCTTRRAMYLGVSILPFYTIVAAEKIGGKLIGINDSSLFATMKIIAIVVVAGLLIAIEYLASGLAFDALMAIKNPRPINPDNVDLTSSGISSTKEKKRKSKTKTEVEKIEDPQAVLKEIAEKEAQQKELDEIAKSITLAEAERLNDTDGLKEEMEPLDPEMFQMVAEMEAAGNFDIPKVEEKLDAIAKEEIVEPQIESEVELEDEIEVEAEIELDDEIEVESEVEAESEVKVESVVEEKPKSLLAKATEIKNSLSESESETEIDDIDNVIENQFNEDEYLVQEQIELDKEIESQEEESLEIFEDEKLYDEVDEESIEEIGILPQNNSFVEPYSDPSKTIVLDNFQPPKFDILGNERDDYEDEKLDAENDIDEIDEIAEIDDELKVDFDELYSSEEAEFIENPFESGKKITVEEAKANADSAEKRPQRKKFEPYSVPTEGLLTVYPDGEYWVIDEATKEAARILTETLHEFKIEAEVTGIRKGPVITMFEILPAPGVKLSKIVALADNIALRLAASSVRIVAPIPGKRAVGIEVPNHERAIVSFKEIINKDLPQFSKMAIPVVLGKDIAGEAQLLDLAKTPHLLIAGSTGSGKSVCVNSLILSILYKRSPSEVKMILIDPKVVELKLYNDIPHLLTPVITEPKRAFQSLQYCLCEMERRYALLDQLGVRDITSYNRRIVERGIAAEKLPYIVVIIDEFADLMATTGKELESTLARLAAMSRAVGIHLVLATQRPSIDVITGLIKANIPTRIAFMVASKMDSRIIIDQVGAEKLLGRGDMLYASAVDPFPVRIQGTFVSDNEVENVVEYVKQYGEPEYIDEEIFVDDEDDGDASMNLFTEGDDPLYDKAVEIVMQAGKASASYIQRRLKIGYNRAARLVEEMEERGLVGPANGSKPREILHVV